MCRNNCFQLNKIEKIKMTHKFCFAEQIQEFKKDMSDYLVPRWDILIVRNANLIILNKCPNHSPKKQETSKKFNDSFLRSQKEHWHCKMQHLTSLAQLPFQGLLANCNKSSALYTQLLHALGTPELELHAKSSH